MQGKLSDYADHLETRFGKRCWGGTVKEESVVFKFVDNSEYTASRKEVDNFKQEKVEEKVDNSRFNKIMLVVFTVILVVSVAILTLNILQS